MSEKHQFRAVIQNEGSGGAFVTVPFDAEKVFGRKRIKVKASIDGEPYRGSLVRMGGEQYLLLVLKEIRQKVGKSFGDEVSVIVEEDLEPRIVELPPDLQQALDEHPGELAYFQQLSYTHQREYVQWVTQAKRTETRLGRIQRMIEMLQQHSKTPL